MIRSATAALALLLACFVHAQQPTAKFSDPANLGGERITPRTGRELPIDGGPGNNNQSDNALGLAQMLRKLDTRASILNIVAHPDDEDGGMLTLNARGLGARVADLSLTRGEGGQNAMTGDFEDALGLLRTQELLANDRYTGVTQMFGTEVDFGFSKTKSEAFAKWTRERVLYDVVRAIRIYRPLVITATFIGNPTDGHGQHQVSGEIAQEAFVAAGDPNVFPELTREGILPWKPLKMYARVPRGAIGSRGLYDYATGQFVPAAFTNYITHITTTTTPSTDIVIHEGTRDPLLTIAATNHADLPPALASDAPSTPLSYIQFARIGLGLQKSQIGPGVRNAPSGAYNVDYHLYGSRICGSAVSLKDCQPERSEGPASSADQPTFFAGIDTSLEGIATLAPHGPPFLHFQLARMAEKIALATRNFNTKNPTAIAPPLADALHTCDALIGLTTSTAFDSTEKASVLHELRIKRVQINNALALALGLELQANVPAKAGDTLVPEQRLSFAIKVSNGAEAVTNLREQFWNTSVSRGAQQKEIGGDLKLTAHGASVRQINLALSGGEALTRPYFTRSDIEQPVYQLIHPALRNAPATPSPFFVTAMMDYADVSIELSATINGLHSYSGARAVAQPLALVPPMAVSLSSHALAVASSSHEFQLTATTKSFLLANPSPAVTLTAPRGWAIVPSTPLPPSTPQFVLHPELDNRDVAATPHLHDVTFTITPPAHFAGQQTLDAVTGASQYRPYEEGYRSVGYPGLPSTNYFTPATDRIVPVDLKLPTKRRIGYLAGTGDAVPQALASIGLPVTMLTVADLTPAKLASFDTIILGVRTYHAHPDLQGAPTQALLDFARNGGNVIVQYQTAEFAAADAPYPLSPSSDEKVVDAPYPLSLGSDEKVVDETAPVVLLEPNNALLTTPNRITSADFNHWIEERGHGFMGSWDPHYTALTETHDPGAPAEHVAPQKPQRGGLLTVQIGKGRWTYVAFALYRQLPEAVPGAYRLMMNLLDPR